MLGCLVGSTGAARRKWPRAEAAFGFVAFALGAWACGGSQPVSRAYGSTELVPIRDATITFNGQYVPGTLVYNTGGGNSGTPLLWWSLDLTTGAVQADGTSAPSSPPPSGTPTSAPYAYVCDSTSTADDAQGTFTLEIVDTSTKAETDINNVVSLALCPDADGIVSLFVVDANGKLALETGPFTALTPVPLPVDLLALVSWEGDMTGKVTGATVLAAQPATPDQLGIDTIDVTTLAVTVDVPPVPASVAWATGATPTGSLQSNSLGRYPGAGYASGGRYVYPRVMGDGGTTIFVGPFSTGAASELALFQVPATGSMSVPISGASGSLAAPSKSLLAWEIDGGSGTAGSLVVWDDTDLEVITCPLSAGAYLPGVWSPDQTKVLFAEPQQTYGSAVPAGPLEVLTFGAPGAAASCQELASDGVLTAAFSPDSAFIFWLIQLPTGESQLWTAASDGSAARMIGSGDIEDAHFITDGGARLEMTLGGELDWLDLHDATGPLHHVAEQVHGMIFDITGGQWLIMGSEWSATDGTETLALINRDDGQVRPISPSVAQYDVLQEELGADGGFVDPYGGTGVGRELLVVYVVRGRNPSAQDGIWRATITPADLQ
jgi:hypothetical protein